MLNLPLPDSAMAIQAANTDRQTDTDPHMVIVLLLVGTACYVSLYIYISHHRNLQTLTIRSPSLQPAIVSV